MTLLGWILLIVLGLIVVGCIAAWWLAGRTGEEASE